MTRTSIEWTDATWNPTRGCSRESPGCVHCYAETMAGRFAAAWGSPEIVKPDGTWSGVLALVPDKLLEPLSWRAPRRVFVDSASDLFHPAVPDEFIDSVFAVMACSEFMHRCRRRECDHDSIACSDALEPPVGHVFQVLTKRHERMLRYMSTHGRPELIVEAAHNDIGLGLHDDALEKMEWPLRKVWLGVSVENQAYADERIPALRKTPAEVRFISYEPALGPVDFSEALRFDAERAGLADDPLAAVMLARAVEEGRGDGPRGVDWIIVGGESGRGARPFDVAWARSTVAACKAAGVPCFVKQLGDNAGPHLHTRLGRGAHANDGEFLVTKAKGGDMSEWPADLRVREFPR